MDNPLEGGGDVSEGDMFLCYLNNHQFLEKKSVQSTFEGNPRFCKYIYLYGDFLMLFISCMFLQFTCVIQHIHSVIYHWWHIMSYMLWHLGSETRSSWCVTHISTECICWMIYETYVRLQVAGFLLVKIALCVYLECSSLVTESFNP